MSSQDSVDMYRLSLSLSLVTSIVHVVAGQLDTLWFSLAALHLAVPACYYFIVVKGGLTGLNGVQLAYAAAGMIRGDLILE